ncbi:MAG: ribonuclease H family protein [Chitinophagaceae bacterium]|nr:ribonuclease H family protein [Chitinophagaceae bacterium]
MGKIKFYVVWKGKEPGIYGSWEACEQQIKGFSGAKYKGFKTRELAEKALAEGPTAYWGIEYFESTLSVDTIAIIGEPIKQSIAVDGAWNTATGDIEYRGVDVLSGIQLFHVGPLHDGTNNIAEFLAIVHALAFCKQKGLAMPIYSDSRNAISWVKKKATATQLEPTERNQKIFELLGRAIKWLESNEYSNEILKWETAAWGENPADFGRK